MSAPSLRSRSGCFACKRRRKKCDESKPICTRCAKSGLECRYIRPPEETKSKTKARFIYEAPVLAGPSMPLHQPHSVAARSLPSPPATLEIVDLPSGMDMSNDLYFPFVPSPSNRVLDFSLPSDDTWHPALIQPASFQSPPTGQTLDQLVVHPDQSIASEQAAVGCFYCAYDSLNSKSPAPERESDMSASLQMLENILEVVSIHFYTVPLPVILALLQATAPVFRRACPEPPEQLVNLPRMLIEPGLYRRYFAVMDVGLSVVTNRPQLFRYDVSYTADVRERMIKLDYTTDYGLEWLYGIPDRFILVLAWINGLREDFYGREVDPDIVARVEEQIRSERVGQNLHTASDSDPVFRIRRLVVQEVWRQVVYIYLYMALCGANASDPRVEKAFSVMMRLIRETKPGRNPDAFLFIPMLACGVAARNEKDRETFKQRIFAVRECSVPGIVGNEGAHVLKDIWDRADAEGRPAVWADFSKSYKIVVGV
ncbi:hypothetical protein RSAG8_12000, partial [Rhizoctonia solani AG-8 WAC10335]